MLPHPGWHRDGATIPWQRLCCRKGSLHGRGVAPREGLGRLGAAVPLGAGGAGRDLLGDRADRQLAAAFPVRLRDPGTARLPHPLGLPRLRHRAIPTFPALTPGGRAVSRRLFQTRPRSDGRAQSGRWLDGGVDAGAAAGAGGDRPLRRSRRLRGAWPLCGADRQRDELRGGRMAFPAVQRDPGRHRAACAGDPGLSPDQAARPAGSDADRPQADAARGAGAPNRLPAPGRDPLPAGGQRRLCAQPPWRAAQTE